MTTPEDTLRVELIMEGGWIIDDGSRYDPSQSNRSLQEISERYFRVGLDFPASLIESMDQGNALECDDNQSHFKRFFDIVETETWSVSDQGNVQIDLSFKGIDEAKYNTSNDDVTLDAVKAAIRKARELNLTGMLYQAYLTSEPGEVRQLRENLAEEPELSMDAYPVGFICDGHILSDHETNHKYAVISGGSFYKLRGDKAFMVEGSYDPDSDELDI